MVQEAAKHRRSPEWLDYEREINGELDRLEERFAKRMETEPLTADAYQELRMGREEIVTRVQAKHRELIKQRLAMGYSALGIPATRKPRKFPAVKFVRIGAASSATTPKKKGKT
jgi:hypothetical protein